MSSGSVSVRLAEPSASAELDVSSCSVSDAPTNAVSSNSNGDIDVGDNNAMSNGISGVRSLHVGSVRPRTPTDRQDALGGENREPRLQTFQSR